MQHTATNCHTLQHTATHKYISMSGWCKLFLCIFDLVQYTAAHCNTLPDTATQCNTLKPENIHQSQDGANCFCVLLIRCNSLQHTDTHCNTLQRTATHYNTELHFNLRMVQTVSVIFDSVQYTATHCNTLPDPATHCNTLKHKYIYQSQDGANCFCLFGIDVMLDQNLHPWLLELNGVYNIHVHIDMQWMYTCMLRITCIYVCLYICICMYVYTYIHT